MGLLSLGRTTVLRAAIGRLYTAAVALQAGRAAISTFIDSPKGERGPNDHEATMDMRGVAEGIKAMLAARQPDLAQASQYYVDGHGKMLRPAIILQLSRSLERANGTPSALLDEQLGVRAGQRRLAEIVEMIHAASLLHDDVIDGAQVRRGRPSANALFSSKSAILAGDYLLAQASVALAQLQSATVIELLATVIKDLVEGEMMQMMGSLEDRLSMHYYLEKSYLKTASLIAKSCRAAALLGESSVEVQDRCYDFGRNLGLAFQVTDDGLDFTSSQEQLGKPAAADLCNGIITAPVLFAIEEFPQLTALIARNFGEPGDVEHASQLVRKSNAARRTRELADNFLDRALQALSFLPPSAVSDSFSSLISTITSRQK